MMTLPHYENAYIDISKLQEYCLNENHPRGKHKAIVFRRTLVITGNEAIMLRNSIMQALQVSEASEIGQDKYGTRFSADLSVTINQRSAVVRTLWIIKHDETFPRLITVYVK